MDLENIVPKGGPTIYEVKKYIQKYNKEIIVIKCGGSVLLESLLLDQFIEDILVVNKLGLNTIIVHGGGKNIKKKLDENKIASKFIDGLRVNDYLQQDASLFGGEIQVDKNTGLDWLSYGTSLEYIFAETSDGEALPYISPLTFNHVFYVDFGSDFSMEVDFIAKAKQGRVADFEEETDGYSVLNLSGNYKTSIFNNDVNLFWRVSNVFDKEYYDHLSRLKTAGIHEMGRNISLGLKYNF